MGYPGFVIGPIAKRDDFWDRKSEVENIWRVLEKNNVLLKAPRRFGKTSIMNHIYENPRDGFTVFFQDTESIREPEEFISYLISKALTNASLTNIFKKTGNMVGQLLSRITISLSYQEMPEFRIGLKEALKNNWQDEGQKLISSLAHYGGGKIVFVLDELPELIKNIERKRDKNTAIDFLNWFRSVRQLPELSHIRWLIGGSIGIEHVVEGVGAGTKTINDFVPLLVGPFGRKEAEKLTRTLLQKEGQISRVSSSAMNAIMEIIGVPVPYFLQILLIETVHEMQRQGRKTISEAMVSNAYLERVLGPTNRTYFEHYYTRLKDYYDSERERIAKKILLEIARQKRVRRKDLRKVSLLESGGHFGEDEFGRLMIDLENDFYINFDKETDCYYFTTKVLMDWWLRYYDMVED
jgi:uncharacterized protein